MKKLKSLINLQSQWRKRWNTLDNWLNSISIRLNGLEDSNKRNALNLKSLLLIPTTFVLKMPVLALFCLPSQDVMLIPTFRVVKKSLLKKSPQLKKTLGMKNSVMKTLIFVALQSTVIGLRIEDQTNAWLHSIAQLLLMQSNANQVPNVI